MNVLQICDFAPSFRGNFMEEMDAIDRALKQSGGTNIYAFPIRNIEYKNQWIEDLKKDYTVYIYGREPKEQLKTFRKIIKEQKPDIIHVHFTNMKTDMCVKAAAAGKGIKLVRHYRSSYGIWSGVKKTLANMVYKSWQYICISPAMAEECKLNLPKCKSSVILNPVCFDRLDAYENLTKKDIIGKDDGILCFMIGYNYRLKGIDLAADAVSKLREKHDIYLAVCVAGHLEEIKEELRNQFGGEIPEWIKFLPPRNDIGSYYRTADICLSPSRSEGACTAAVEEAYSEKVVIASNCPGQFSYMNGLLDILWFENKNSDDLKEKIEQAITHIDDKELFKRNRENALRYYDLDVFAEKVNEIYKSL